MCALCDGGGPVGPAVGRRALLSGLGAAGLALGAVACGSSGQAAAQSTGAVGSAKLELVLLGTKAGPPPSADRAGISTALVVDGQVYLIDAGRASVTQYAKAGLSLGALRGIFLTHLHIDHIADYFNYFVLGGYPDEGMIGAKGPVAVYGPGPAGGLLPKFGGGNAPVVAPQDPTPGTRALTENWNRAVAYSSNVFIRDTGASDPMALMNIHEIQIPAIGADFTNRAPTMQPFEVMRDDKVRVTAVLVPHGPVFPAFAFRFDTAYGSVTFSGDTTYTDNIPTLAHNTDVLVHEAINLEGSSLSAVEHNHMVTSHVEVQKVGAIAQRAGAKRLVLSHIADLASPHIDSSKWHDWASTGYSNNVIIGDDLQYIPVH